MYLTHPLLADCRRLFLRKYMVHINIGVHEIEKRDAQRVWVDIDLYIPLALSTPRHDQLDEVVDYDFMRETIMQCVGQRHIHLQETLCDEIVQALLQHRAVRAVRVSTAKPDVYADCEAVGVEVFRFNTTL